MENSDPEKRTEELSSAPSASETPESATKAGEKPAPTWDSLGLSQATLERIAEAGFAKPTPIQAGAIPLALEGEDIIGSAQTGTGKTASFVLPIVEKLAGKEGTYGLILAPTREIAQQIQQVLEYFGAPRGLRSIVLIGGIDMKVDAQAINTYPQVIVATPGRLCDHLDRGNIWLDFIQIVVLDEADRMLDMGFSAQLDRIMSEVPESRQTLLFSATFPPSVERLARKILHNPKSVTVDKPQSTAGGVEQRLLWMKEEAKNRELLRLLREEPGSIMVFTRSKDGATRVWRALHSAGVYDATYIHSDRLQSHREQALAEFKEGKFRILIATDVAARGIHVDQVAHVVNYDLPLEPENYVHRLGRTGRAGATGKCTTFVTPRDRGLIRQIEKLIGKPIPAEYSSSMKEDRPRGAVEGQDRSRDSEREGRGRRGGRRKPGAREQKDRRDQPDQTKQRHQERDGVPSRAQAPKESAPDPASSQEPREGQKKTRSEVSRAGASRSESPRSEAHPGERTEPGGARKRSRRRRGPKDRDRRPKGSGNSGGGTAFPV